VVLDLVLDLLRQIEPSRTPPEIGDQVHCIVRQEVGDGDMDTARIHGEIAQRLGKVESILDVGCGNGTLVRHLADRVAREAIGIDIAGSSFSEKRISEDGRAYLAECVQGDGRSMGSFADNRFDAVVTVRAFHELSDPIAALREARRVLKPGGTVLIADFAKGHVGERMWGESYYTPEQTEAMLKKCGFERVKAQQIPGEHFLLASGKKAKSP